MVSSNLLMSLFAKSPLGPIQQHMEVVHQCALLLPEFFKAAQQRDWESAENTYNAICKLESEADEIKRELRLNLPKGLFLAVSRTDLLDLLSKQDKIANQAQDISGLAFGRHMVFPEVVSDLFFDFIERCVDASAQANKAIHELDELLTTGFRGREVSLVEKMINELSRIETETDELQVKLRRLLFDLEKELPPVDVIFFYKIMDWIGDLADRAQSVGTRLELMMAS